MLYHAAALIKHWLIHFKQMFVVKLLENATVVCKLLVNYEQ